MINLNSGQNNFKGPLFIVGMPRSGTKLLRDLLNNHPAIAIPNAETEIFPYWANHWLEYGDLFDFGTFLKFYNSAAKTSFFYYMKKQNGRCISAKEWYQACEGGTVTNVFEALVRLDTGCTKNMIWGDKSPSYINHIPLLMQLFPNSKLIHIVRDVRDYCLSINKAWGKNMLRAAQRWADDIRNVKTALASYPNQIIEVRFEDLLDNPQCQLQIICKFIGIEFDKTMLFLNKATENIGDAKGAKEIITGNKGKWQTNLNLKKIKRIEAICRDRLRTYRYPITYQGPVKRIHPIKMLLLKLLDGVNLVFHDIEERGFLKNVFFYLRAVQHSISSKKTL